MKPYIVQKRCDHTPGCPVIPSCPQNIFIYDYRLEVLRLQNPESCTGCMICETECDYDAVRIVDEDHRTPLKESDQRDQLIRAEIMAPQYNSKASPLDEWDAPEITTLSGTGDQKAVIIIYADWSPLSLVVENIVKDVAPSLPRFRMNADLFPLDELEEVPLFLLMENGEIQGRYNLRTIAYIGE